LEFFVGLGGGLMLAGTVWLTLITVYACKQPRLVRMIFMTKELGLTKVGAKSNPFNNEDKQAEILAER